MRASKSNELNGYARETYLEKVLDLLIQID